MDFGSTELVFNRRGELERFHEAILKIYSRPSFKSFNSKLMSNGLLLRFYVIVKPPLSETPHGSKQQKICQTGLSG